MVTYNVVVSVARVVGVIMLTVQVEVLILLILDVLLHALRPPPHVPPPLVLRYIVVIQSILVRDIGIGPVLRCLCRQ